MRKMIYLFAVIWATLNTSAYCNRGVTASGEYVRNGICAMDKLNGMVVPFNSKVYLPDGRVLTVKDRFGAGHNNHLDIWMDTESECWKWGRRWIRCRIETP